MPKKYFLIFWLSFLTSSVLYSQTKTSSFQLEANIIYALLPTYYNTAPNTTDPWYGIDRYENLMLELGINIYLSRYFRLGFSYSRSIWGDAKMEDGYTDTNIQSRLTNTGLNFKLSTDRANNWRACSEFSFSLLSINQENPTNDINYNKTLDLASISVGIERRISKKIDWNVIQVAAPISGENIPGYTVGLSFATGVTYNFRAKSK